MRHSGNRPTAVRSLSWVTAICLAAIAVLGLAAAWAASPPVRPVDVVRSFQAAAAAGDVEQQVSLLASDVTWRVYGGSTRTPYQGDHTGHAGVLQFLERVEEAVEVHWSTPAQYLADGDVVAVRRFERGSARATGGLFEAQLMLWFRVDGGRITRVEQALASTDIDDAFALPSADLGRAYFTGCAGCHGLRAEGNELMQAPALAGQPESYLVRQLRNYLTRQRGGPEDYYGWQMHGRAAALPSDRALRDVSRYIAGLSGLRPRPSRHLSNTVSRRQLYLDHCASCHGNDAQGNAAASAPALLGLFPEYQVRQLQAFLTGARGLDPKDGLARSMRDAVLPISAQTLHEIASFLAEERARAIDGSP